MSDAIGPGICSRASTETVSRVFWRSPFPSEPRTSASFVPEELEASLSGTKLALVLGSEGKGLRQKTRDTVSVLARLHMPGPIASLNVSNAAAVALYAARKFLGG